MTMYKVEFKINSELNTVLNNLQELMQFLKEQFPNATQKFYEMFCSRMKSTKIPYKNNNFSIIPRKAVKKINPPKIKWKNDIPKNDSPDLGSKVLYNEWIIYNTKNDKHTSFNKLAVLARTLDIKYSYLYNTIKNHNHVILDDLIIYRNSTLEGIYYSEKIKEMMRNK